MSIPLKKLERRQQRELVDKLKARGAPAARPGAEGKAAMDEFWQRYRTFWTPLLIGLGVFLVGVIVIHAVTDDPAVEEQKALAEARAVKGKIAPDEGKVAVVKDNLGVLDGRLRDWAKRVDQAGLADPLETATASALSAALLRGATPAALGDALARPDAPGSPDLLLAFEGDTVAAGKALARYEEVRVLRLNLLRSGDPNVGFSQLLNDVWSELKVRANRADVELKTDVLGFGGVTSITRAVLEQRVLNLALVARIVDLAIRSGVAAVLEVRLDQKPGTAAEDAFLRQWPLTVTLRGDLASLRPTLALLTDPERPIPVTNLVLTQPPRGSPLEGQVQLQATVESTLVRPDASLALEME